jgi:uncharacterized protein (TIGR00255 family)
MLKSMTGFGKAIYEAQNITATVEVKTLNSKFSDIYCRIPKAYSAREIEIRNYLTQNLERGKVEFNLLVQKKAEASNVSINRPLFEAYHREISATTTELLGGVSNEELFRQIMLLPDILVTNTESEEQTEAEWQVIWKAVEKAVAHCNDFRLREGRTIADKFSEYIHSIAAGLDAVEEQDKTRIPALRERLEKSVKDLVQDESFDRNRFEQELIYYVEKFDISEEKIRLRTHLNYFLEVLKKEGNGKKLNFLSQEIGREINTIGSKANDAIIQRTVVNMKDELEKIKEQTMNVL